MEQIAKNIARYFTSALAAQTMKVIDFKKDKFWTISFDALISGELETSCVAEIKRTAAKGKKVKEEISVPVILVAKVLKTSFQDGLQEEPEKEELTGIFYIPAQMSNDGELTIPEDNKLPWIPREFLVPMMEPVMSVGKLEDYDGFLAKSLDSKYQLEDWSDYLQYAADMFEAVTKGKLAEEELQVSDRKLIFDANVYLLIDETVHASHHIISLYRNMLSTDSTVPLFEKLVQMKEEESVPLLSVKDIRLWKTHCGQMGGEYPLSPSQREALYHTYRLEDGEILAVNGPPGTGKTTLLQSVVADMYVQRALDKGEPPLIFATSTNNQAVTNIIDSFGKIESVGMKNLESRWIEGVHSFAVYLPSDSKKKEAEKKGYHFTSAKGDEFAGVVDQEENLKRSEEKMLQECSNYLNAEMTSIAQCEKLIHQCLCHMNADKDACLAILEELEKLIGEQSYLSFLEEKTDLIESCKEKISKLKEDMNQELELVSKRRKRLEGWRAYYSRLPWYLRLLSFLPFVKRKVQRYLETYKEPDEEASWPQPFDMASILEFYNKSIAEGNRNFNKKKELLLQEETRQRNLQEEIEKSAVIQDRLSKKLASIENNWEVGLKNKKDYQRAIAECDKQSINEMIDSSLRYVMFWLAVHYYECRWLGGENSISEKQRGTNYASVLIRLYRRLALITPCLVSTFYMLPKHFLAYDGNEKKEFYLYNQIDLLIVDEAGQVSTEIGAASFALAKKAIVVGDEQQIPPVWGTERALDITLAIEKGVIKEKRGYEKLEQVGITCASSSVMRAASASCRFEKYQKKGLFLSEHRRCYDEIISYCNELVYDGRLQPLRGSAKQDKGYPLKSMPQMGFYDVSIDKSERVGTSRINRLEAEKISMWLMRNYQIISDAYDGPEKLKLGIITPFKAQVGILKSMLKEKLPESVTDIEVGTVHTFQGAERRVIILSTVYGAEDGCYFVDKNKSLMNVAVSRAKDAFVVFGARKCLGTSNDSASGLLQKHVNTELPDVLKAADEHSPTHCLGNCE